MDSKARIESESNTDQEFNSWFTWQLQYLSGTSFDPNISDDMKTRKIHYIRARATSLGKQCSVNEVEVDLSNKEISHQIRVELLVEVMLQNPNITKINFAHNLLAGQKIFELIGKLINGLPSLKCLDLSDTIIAEGEIQHLVDTILNPNSGRAGAINKRKGEGKNQSSKKSKKQKKEKKSPTKKEPVNTNNTMEVENLLENVCSSSSAEKDVVYNKEDANVKTLCINNCGYLPRLPSILIRENNESSTRTAIGNGWVLVHENIGEVFRTNIDGCYDDSDDDSDV